MYTKIKDFSFIRSVACVLVGGVLLAASLQCVKESKAVDAGSSNLTFTAISLGQYHSAGLDSEGKLYTWGYNNLGQLGNSTTANSYTPICLNDISGNPFYGKTVAQIALGCGHCVALDGDGKFYDWGNNGHGELAIGSETASSTPICLSSLSGNLLYGKTFTQVAAGGYTIGAIDSSGKLYICGLNGSGQLGVGTTSNTTTAFCLNDISGNAFNGKVLTKVALGTYHSAAIDSDKKLYVWGTNENGQIGNGADITSYFPSPLCLSGVSGNPLYGKSITQVALGDSHSAAIDSDGKLYTWGCNNYGQLGNGSTTDSTTPVCLTTLSGNPLYGKSITQIELGVGFSSAIDSNNQLYVWGRNSDGQLGRNNTTKSTTPICLTTLSGGVLKGKTIASASIGDGFSSAIDSNGRAYSWGYNKYGRLGNNTTTSSTIPFFLGSPHVVQFVNSLFSYQTCNQYSEAYAALHSSYAAMDSYEKGQLTEAVRLDYPTSGWDGTTYTGSKTQSVTALDKWNAICTLSGNPLSSGQSASGLSDATNEVAIVLSLILGSLLTAIALLRRKTKRRQ